MAAPSPRNVTPIIAKIRNFLSQRQVINHLRFEQKYTPRTLPAANLPNGTSHKMSANYYFTRDGRKANMPPTSAYESGVKKLDSGEQKAENVPASSGSKIFRPGNVYNWDM